MLYIVATPIGNLKEITNRAITTLNFVDYILCEDTRTSGVLLNSLDIKTKLVSYHKFNEKEQLDSIIKDLKNNLDIALISDAGMPAISDPGNILINAVISERLDYTVVSGATALINAFVLSGYSAPFTFIGFLPNKSSDKKELLKEIKDYSTTLIFYVSPHNINKEMQELYEMLGDRKVFIARELTKMYETLEHTTLSKGYTKTLKGEFVLVVQGKSKDDNPLNSLSVEEHLDFYLSLGYTKRDAIDMVGKDRGVKKNEIYKFTLR